MTEQELRVAVAGYDAKLANDMLRGICKNGSLKSDANSDVLWYVSQNCIQIENGCHRQTYVGFDVSDIHATMRAMDAAARAFQEALK